MEHSSSNLRRALDWLRTIVTHRLKNEGGTGSVDVPILELVSDDSGLERFVREHQPTHEELFVVLLALAPHLDPQFFDAIVGQAVPEGGDLAALGGVRGTSHRGVLPTGETALYLLCGSDLESRLRSQALFGTAHWFAKRGVLSLERVPEGEPQLSGRLVMKPETIEQITLGHVSKPRFSTSFPAELITTELDWDDLVLHPATLSQIRDIQNWIAHNDTAMREWGLGRRVKPGYRALFHGPPGTGKTLTATLLGKSGGPNGRSEGRDVFRIDLSLVVSKWVGETEQNLARLFDRAESKDWILFFDEADALFGKRTEIRDAQDKYSNQQAAYLLQRIEGFDGLVILATNQRSSIDEAFVRRFQSVIHFPMPRAEERLQLWQSSLPRPVELSEGLDLREISARYEISGASILNVVQHCSIGMLADGTTCMDRGRLEHAIQREFVKEGRVV